MRRNPAGSILSNILSRLPTIALISAVSLLVGSCASGPPVRAPLSDAGAATLNSFEGPACGARLYVAMGENTRYPGVENLRPQLGEFFVEGLLVDTLTSNPEFSVIDVPAGNVHLSWMIPEVQNPSLTNDNFARNRAEAEVLSLNLTDGEVVFVVLNWHDDTNRVTGFLFGPLGDLATAAYRAEVVRVPNSTPFIGKRAVYHRALPNIDCTQSAPTLAQSTPGPATLPPQNSGPGAARSEYNGQLLTQCLNYLSSEGQCGCFLGRLGQRTDQEIWALLVSLQLDARTDDPSEFVRRVSLVEPTIPNIASLNACEIAP